MLHQTAGVTGHSLSVKQRIQQHLNARRGSSAYGVMRQQHVIGVA